MHSKWLFAGEVVVPGLMGEIGRTLEKVYQHSVPAYFNPKTIFPFSTRDSNAIKDFKK